MEGSTDLTTEQQDELPRAMRLAQHAESIRQLHKRSIADIIEIGHRLSDCKKLLEHGDWLPWLQREFTWSERTARNYIAVYEFFASKPANVADLSIDLTTLYLITAPSTPKEASTEAISRIGAGEALSRADVQRIVWKAKKHQVNSRQILPSVTLKEMLERTGYKVLRRLSGVERELHLELALREGPEIALEWAEHRASLKKKFRDLLLGVEFLETTANSPIRRIVDAIPSEKRGTIAERLRVLSELLSQLRSHLMRD